MQPRRLVRKHPRIIRYIHWANVPVLTVMVYSGLRIYWANDIYRIGWGEWTLLKFFPEWFYKALVLDHQLSQGMAWHFAFAWAFTGLGIAYVAAVAFTGEWRNLLPNRASVGEAIGVVLHDLHLTNTPPPPRKFNGAQRFAYTGVVVMGTLMVVTGLAMLKPVQLAWLTALCGGYEAARLIHFVVTMAFLGFVAVHLGQVFKAGWNNLRAMIMGSEIVGPEPSWADEPSNAPGAVAPVKTGARRGVGVV